MAKYNQTSPYSDVIEAVSRIAGNVATLEADTSKVYAKLVSLKVDRVAMYDADQLLDPADQKYAPGLVDANAKMVATYAPGETIPTLYADEAEAAILAIKAMVDGAAMDAIRKFA